MPIRTAEMLLDMQALTGTVRGFGGFILPISFASGVEPHLRQLLKRLFSTSGAVGQPRGTPCFGEVYKKVKNIALKF